MFSENLVDADCFEASDNSSHSLETTSTDNPFHVRSRYCQEFRRATLQLLRLTAQSKSPASVIQKEKLERSKKERCSKGKLHHKPLRTSTHTHYVPKLARPRQRASDDTRPEKSLPPRKLEYCTYNLSEAKLSGTPRAKGAGGRKNRAAQK